MTTCVECAAAIEGDARVVAGVVMHPACAVAAEHRRQGRPFKCPVCHGKGRWYTEAHEIDHTKDPDFGYGGEGGPGDTRSFREFVPAKTETCAQCHGHGHVPKEPKQVPTGFKWETE